MFVSEDDALLRRAAEWPGHRRLTELSEESVETLVRAQGIDFATAVLFDRMQRARRLPATFTNLPTNGNLQELLVAVAPEAFYREHPGTGADGQRILDVAKRLGMRKVRIPLDSFGTLQQNAAILTQWLSEHAFERMILVSLSKGSADVKTALAYDGAERVFRPVQAWLNFSGMLDGTALANWLLARRLRTALVKLLCWWHGYPFGMIEEIQHGPGGALSQALRLPPHLLAVHVVGFPLKKHLSSPLARRAYRRLAPLGPNDGGGSLLADAVHWPGLVLPVWGADHYFHPNHVAADELIANLLFFVGGPDAGREVQRTAHENPTAFAGR